VSWIILLKIHLRKDAKPIMGHLFAVIARKSPRPPSLHANASTARDIQRAMRLMLNPHGGGSESVKVNL